MNLVTQISSRALHGAYCIKIAAPCFGYVKWPPSGCNYHKCKKGELYNRIRNEKEENYTPVATVL